MKKLFMVAACLLAAVCMFTACQPTPDVAPVVNKKEEIPKDSIKEEGQEEDGQTNQAEDFYEPVEYEVIEHWQEEIKKQDRFVVQADIDVKMPVVDKFPVEKLERAKLPQERVDQMINHLLGEGQKFYQYPTRPAKPYYEGQLLALKKELAMWEDEGEMYDVEGMKAHIKEVEQQLAEAPAQKEIEYIDTSYTYMYDWDTGAPMTSGGDGYISLAAATDDGSMGAMVQASRGDEYGANFYFSDCNYYTETDVKNSEKWLKEDEERLARIENETERANEEKYVNENREFVESGNRLIASNTIDLQQAQQQAIALLQEFDIHGLQVTKCEKALLEPQQDYFSSYEMERTFPDANGVFVEFQRECGGVPGITQMGGIVVEKKDWTGAMYSAPFYLESARIVIDEQGDVVMFSWDSAAQVVETVAADMELLPFEEIKKRAVDHLYFLNTYHYGEGEDMDSRGEWMRYELDKAELKMTYVNAKDDPDRVLMVPAWYFGAQGYYSYDDSEMGEQLFNYDEVLINALDGGAILMPGSDVSYDEPEATAEPAAEPA